MNFTRTFSLGLCMALCGISAPQVRADTHGTATATDGASAACAGVPDALRAGSLLHDRTVLAVRPLARRVGKQMWWKPQGAEILIAPQAGDSAPWLRRVLRCQLASAADDMRRGSPVAVARSEVSLHPAGDAFALRITTDRRDNAREILQRARSLQVDHQAP